MDEPRRRFAAMMSGLDIHYDLGDGHPVGCTYSVSLQINHILHPAEFVHPTGIPSRPSAARAGMSMP